MSQLIRSLLPRLTSYAVGGDFVDERSIADVIEKSHGTPTQDTAMKQIAKKNAGQNPTPMTTKIQLDRP
jgi:hypothetical protein